MACARSITKFDETGSIVLDHDALDRILTKLGESGRRFAIISIAGEMRTGKSFLLNFLIRCLRNGGPSSPSWIGGGETRTEEGFVWCGGSEPVTQGIQIWDEIFTLTRGDGEKISVLLMDTQGLFDHDTVPGNNVKLFTLSALASSVQIINVFRQITEIDLEHLQLCVEYADAVASEDSQHFKLQDLVMLVRDWPFADDYFYGVDGGEGYMKSILAKRGHEAELKRSFVSLKCFLMPSPGPEVNKQKSFKGRNSELNEEFLEQVKNFTNQLLDPEYLSLKATSVKELGKFLMACDNSFKSGEVPEVTSILEASSRAFWESKNDECVEMFNRDLEEELQDIFPKSNAELESIFQSTLHSALQQFDGYKQFISSTSRQKFRDHLEKKCSEHYDAAKEKNALKLEAIRQKIRNDDRTSFNSYEGDMIKACRGPSKESSILEALHNESFNEALSEFKELTKGYEALAKEFEGELEKEIEARYDKIKEDNERKVREEKLAKKAKQLELHLLKENLHEDYQEKMREELLGKCLPNTELEKLLGKNMQQTLELFDKQMKDHPDYAKRYRKNFEEKLKSLNQEFRDRNARTREDVIREKEIAMKNILMEFKALMMQVLHFKYVDPKTLREKSSKFFEANLKLCKVNSGAWRDEAEFRVLEEMMKKDYEKVNEELLLQNQNNEELRAQHTEKSGNKRLIEFLEDLALVGSLAEKIAVMHRCAGIVVLGIGGAKVIGKHVMKEVKRRINKSE